MATKLLKNAQIAEEYGIFRGSVGNWVKSALAKENHLQLEMSNGKWYIIDNQHNRSELINLRDRAKKYKNKSTYQKITANPKLYDIFNYANLVELITKLEDDKIIPLKFSYLDRGADIWSDFLNDTVNTNEYYALQGNKLMNDSLTYIKDLMGEYDTINIVDVGCGNGITLQPLFNSLLQNGFKINYTGIDISARMLEIAKTNLNTWYPQIEVKTEIGDMDYVVIREKLFSNKLQHPNSCNLVLFLGYTIGNVYDSHRVFRNFYDSMSQDDFFIFDNGLDLIPLRTIFKTPEAESTKTRISWIPNLLGITEEMFERINKFDEVSKRRIQVLKLNKDLDIEFDISGNKKVVSFKDGDEITVWSHFSHTLDNLIQDIRDVNLGISYISRSPDKSEVMMICQVD